jgi:hypothetical protein
MYQDNAVVSKAGSQATSEVFDSIEAVEKRLSALRNEVAKLTERLSPVLAPPELQESLKTADQTGETAPRHISSRLHSATATIEGLEYSINKLFQRLEI